MWLHGYILDSPDNCVLSVLFGSVVLIIIMSPGKSRQTLRKILNRSSLPIPPSRATLSAMKSGLTFLLLLFLASASYAQLELPAYSPSDEIVKHSNYTLQYNEKYEEADWVAYKLTKNMLETIHPAKRKNVFKSDPLVPAEFIGKKNMVAVPKKFYKVISDDVGPDLKMIAFVIPQTAAKDVSETAQATTANAEPTRQRTNGQGKVQPADFYRMMQYGIAVLCVIMVVRTVVQVVGLRKKRRRK